MMVVNRERNRNPKIPVFLIGIGFFFDFFQYFEIWNIPILDFEIFEYEQKTEKCFPISDPGRQAVVQRPFATRDYTGYTSICLLLVNILVFVILLHCLP